MDSAKKIHETPLFLELGKRFRFNFIKFVTLVWTFIEQTSKILPLRCYEWHIIS